MKEPILLYHCPYCDWESISQNMTLGHMKIKHPEKTEDKPSKQTTNLVDNGNKNVNNDLQLSSKKQSKFKRLPDLGKKASKLQSKSGKDVVTTVNIGNTQAMDGKLPTKSRKPHLTSESLTAPVKDVSQEKHSTGSLPTSVRYSIYELQKIIGKNHIVNRVGHGYIFFR